MSDNNKLAEVSTDTFQAHELGLVVKGKPSIEEWLEYGRKLRRVESSMMWIIGDYLVHGEFKYGEKYAQALDEAMIETWKVYHWTAKRVPPENRRSDLSWTHHRQVASLPPEYQVLMLDKAAEQHLSTRDMSRMMLYVSDSVHEEIVRVDVKQAHKYPQKTMDWIYKMKLKQMLDDAIEAGVSVEMRPEVYSMYVRMSGTGRCPHCGNIIILADFFATKEKRSQNYVFPKKATWDLKSVDDFDKPKQNTSE